MTETEGFGAWLRSCRQSAGLSQEALAGRAGLSVRAVGNLECANVVLHLVSVISRHLTVVAAAKADDHPGALHPLSLGIAIHVRVIPLRAFGSGTCQAEPDRPFSLIDRDSLDVAVPEQLCSSPIDVAFSEGLAVPHSVRRAVQHEVPDRQVELADRFE